MLPNSRKEEFGCAAQFMSTASMFRFVRNSLFLVVTITVCATSRLATADEFRPFYIDPERSHMTLVGGDASFELAPGDFAFASLQSALDPGINTPLSGQFIGFSIGDFDAPSGFGILSGTGDVRMHRSRLQCIG